MVSTCFFSCSTWSLRRNDPIWLAHMLYSWVVQPLTSVGCAIWVLTVWSISGFCWAPFSWGLFFRSIHDQQSSCAFLACSFGQRDLPKVVFPLHFTKHKDKWLNYMICFWSCFLCWWFFLVFSSTGKHESSDLPSISYPSSHHFCKLATRM